MKYKESINTHERPYWKDDVDTEHKKFVENCVWEVRDKNIVPPDEHIISSTWAMKKKSDGTHRARLNAEGFEQDDGVHYTKNYVLAPVVNDITIRIVFTLMIMDAWWSELWDVKRAFLIGRFNKEEELYM